jgi:signal transduction histidine kinase
MSRSDQRTATPGADARTGPQPGPRRPEEPELEREIARLESALLEQARRAVREKEADREFLARELHDKFGQYLTVMDMELAALLEQDGNPSSTQARLQRLKDLTAEARTDMANMAWQMRPGSLEGLDLEAACTRLVQEWSERSGLAFDLHVSLRGTKLPADVEMALYRVLQEALTNVAKHAGATRAGVILRAEARHVVLVVEDNGAGFALDEDRNDAPFATLGLRGIQERLTLVSGTLEIETGPSLGTTLLMRVPL